jgi:transcriptional regulator with XRE-family HTH domain
MPHKKIPGLGPARDQLAASLIREAMAVRDLNMRELAVGAGVSPSYISDVLRGRRPASLTQLDRILAVMDFRLEVVMTLEPISQPESTIVDSF